MVMVDTWLTFSRSHERPEVWLRTVELKKRVLTAVDRWGVRKGLALLMRSYWLSKLSFLRCSNRYPGLKNSGEYVAVWDSATQHDLHMSDVWRSFREAIGTRIPAPVGQLQMCIWNTIYSWNSWWVFLNHFNIFFDALRHESHNRAIRIDLQKRSALGWIFFQGGRMPKGSTKRWYACPHECMFCICFVYFICWMFYIFCRFKSQRKQTQQQEVIKPRYWAHLKKFKDEAFAKGFGWRRFCQRACICHLSLVFFQQILCFCWLSLPLRPSLYLQVKSVFKLPQDTYAGKRSVQEAGCFCPATTMSAKKT